jgi:hypothetical protein
VARNSGEYLQTAVQAALKAFCEKNPAVWHRFYDTHSAGRFLPTQPGDFLLISRGTAHLIECKSSDTGESLDRLARRSPEQIGKHKLWARAGAHTWYIYHNKTEDCLEIKSSQKNNLEHKTFEGISYLLAALHFIVSHDLTAE